MNDEQRLVEERLQNATWELVATEMKPLPSALLVALLSSKNAKIADTAASYLVERRDVPLVIDAVLNDRLKTKLGRVRATWVLNATGRSFPDSVLAYLHCLKDRSDDVFGNSLFGIVFMQRRDLIPKLRDHLSLTQRGSARFGELERAIHALETSNPSQFSPGFLDIANVWQLDGP